MESDQISIFCFLYLLIFLNQNLRFYEEMLKCQNVHIPKLWNKKLWEASNIPFLIFTIGFSNRGQLCIHGVLQEYQHFFTKLEMNYSAKMSVFQWNEICMKKKLNMKILHLKSLPFSPDVVHLTNNHLMKILIICLKSCELFDNWESQTTLCLNTAFLHIVIGSQRTLETKYFSHCFVIKGLCLKLKNFKGRW